MSEIAITPVSDYRHGIDPEMFAAWLEKLAA